MKRRVHIELRASSQANANGHRTAIENALSGRALFATDLAPVAANDGSGWATRSQLRFVNDADADAVYAAIVARLSLTSALAGSEVHWHDCTHDEADPWPCVIAGRTAK